MKLIQNERIICVDVDDTLVMHLDDALEHEDLISIVDTVDGANTICVVPNRPMIRLVKEEIARGSQVLIWSRGGFQWACNVVEALGLDTFAEQYEAELVVLTKPYAYFDDKDVSEWLKDRVYLPYNVPYKE